MFYYSALYNTCLCTCMFLTSLYSLPSCLRDACPYSSSASSSVCLFFYCWICENECEATLHTVPLMKQQHTIDLSAFMPLFVMCLFSKVAWIEDIPSTFILFCVKCQYDFFCVNDRVTVLLTRIKDVLYCVLLSPVLRNCSKALLMPAFIYHAIPFSNIYLLNVVYHLIYSIPLSVSFRIK